MNSTPIVLVEDNHDDEMLFRRALKQHRIMNHVVVLRDGAEALDYLLGSGTPHSRDPIDAPPLILLDLKLPKVDGLEVLRRIRADERTSALPVVILTSSSEERDLVQAYGLKVNSYLVKPVDFSQFGDMVAHLGLYWLVLNQLPPCRRIA